METGKWKGEKMKQIMEESGVFQYGTVDTDQIRFLQEVREMYLSGRSLPFPGADPRFSGRIRNHGE